MHNEHSILYTLHSTVHCTVYTVVHIAVYTVHFTMQCSPDWLLPGDPPGPGGDLAAPLPVPGLCQAAGQGLASG